MQITIKNRNNQPISLGINRPQLEPTTPQRIACLIHGLGGNKNEAQFGVYSQTLGSLGYITICHTAFYTRGEFGDLTTNGTITNYLQDFEDVMAWVNAQPWYSPAITLLLGHSLGAAVALQFALEQPQLVSKLILLSTAPTGPSVLSSLSPKQRQEGEQLGYYLRPRSSGASLFHKTSFALIKDATSYNHLEKASEVTIPTLIIIGEKDRIVPVIYSKLLFKQLGTSQKKLQLIPGAGHTFTSSELDQIALTIEQFSS